MVERDIQDGICSGSISPQRLLIFVMVKFYVIVSDLEFAIFDEKNVFFINTTRIFPVG